MNPLVKLLKSSTLIPRRMTTEKNTARTATGSEPWTNKRLRKKNRFAGNVLRPGEAEGVGVGGDGQRFVSICDDGLCAATYCCQGHAQEPAKLQANAKRRKQGRIGAVDQQHSRLLASQSNERRDASWRLNVCAHGRAGESEKLSHDSRDGEAEGGSAASSAVSKRAGHNSGNPGRETRSKTKEAGG